MTAPQGLVLPEKEESGGMEPRAPQRLNISRGLARDGGAIGTPIEIALCSAAVMACNGGASPNKNAHNSLLFHNECAHRHKPQRINDKRALPLTSQVLARHAEFRIPPLAKKKANA